MIREWLALIFTIIDTKTSFNVLMYRMVRMKYVPQLEILEQGICMFLRSKAVSDLPLGMPNVLFTTTANVRDSWVKDSFIDITRRFNNYHRGEFKWSIRHDIPNLRMNYGIECVIALTVAQSDGT